MSRVFYNCFPTSSAQGCHDEEYLSSSFTMVPNVSQLPRPPRASNPAPVSNQELEHIQREEVSWNHERIEETECQGIQKERELTSGISNSWSGDADQARQIVDQTTQRPFIQDVCLLSFGSTDKGLQKEPEKRPILIKAFPRHLSDCMELPKNVGFSFSPFSTDKTKQNSEMQDDLERIIEREESSRVRSEMLESMRLSRISLAKQDVSFHQVPMESWTGSQHKWDLETPTLETFNYIAQNEVKELPYVQGENGQRQWCNLDTHKIGNYELSLGPACVFMGSASVSEAVSNTFENERDLKSQGLPLKECGTFFEGLKAIPMDSVIDPPLYSCFNCWKSDHLKAKCPHPPMLFCYNCGQRGTSMNDCPRCGEMYRQHMTHHESFPVYTNKSSWQNEPSKPLIAVKYKQSPLKHKNDHLKHTFVDVCWNQRSNIPQPEHLPVVFGGAKLGLQEISKEVSPSDERPSAPLPREIKWDISPVLTVIPSAKDVRQFVAETKHLPRDTQDAILRVLLGIDQDVKIANKEELQRTLTEVRHLSVELQDQILRVVLAEMKKI